MKRIVTTAFFMASAPFLCAQAQQQVPPYGQNVPQPTAVQQLLNNAQNAPAQGTPSQQTGTPNAPAKQKGNFEKSAFGAQGSAQGSSFDRERSKAKAKLDEAPVDMRGGGIQPYGAGNYKAVPRMPAPGSSD